KSWLNPPDASRSTMEPFLRCREELIGRRASNVGSPPKSSYSFGSIECQSGVTGRTPGVPMTSLAIARPVSLLSILLRVAISLPQVVVRELRLHKRRPPALVSTATVAVAFTLDTYVTEPRVSRRPLALVGVYRDLGSFPSVAEARARRRLHIDVDQALLGKFPCTWFGKRELPSSDLVQVPPRPRLICGMCRRFSVRPVADVPFLYFPSLPEKFPHHLVCLRHGLDHWRSP